MERDLEVGKIVRGINTVPLMTFLWHPFYSRKCGLGLSVKR